MKEFIETICPEPRELTPRERELAAKAKKTYRSPSDNTEKQNQLESQESNITTSNKKTKKIILFENDIPREYILE